MQFAFCNLFSTAAVAAEDGRKVVIPFDFVSQWDQGRYGELVGEMIWKKLDRQGGFILPESIEDVRDFCRSRRLRPSPKTDLKKMKKIVTGDFGAQIGIWGGVERAPGTTGDIYDLVIKCVDFSSAEPKVIYQVNTRTKSVSEIPHLYVKQMLDALYGRKPGGPPPPDPLAEEKWAKNPNLVTGGDFQSGVPKGWEAVAGQQREPLGNLVRWIPEKGNPKNRLIHLEFPKSVGDTTGVMYYSEFFPVEEGAKYRFQCRYRTDGPKVKVFVKCYDHQRSAYQTDPKKTASTGAARRGKIDYLPEESQRREVYRAQMNLDGKKNRWQTHTQEFTPRHTKYTPRWGRVMLYAYLGAGAVQFDDVVVKQIVPASPGQHQKRRRHSLETKVTIEEMQENQRRGKK